MQKKPGKQSYEGATENGVTTSSHGPCPESFIVSDSYEMETYTYIEYSYNIPLNGAGLTWDSKPVQASCAMTAKELAATTAIVSCPKNCNTHRHLVQGSHPYSEHSPMCAAAIDAEKITSEGGIVLLQKNEEEKSFEFLELYDFQTSTQTDIQYSIPESEKTDRFKPPTVEGTCTTTAKDLPLPITEVICTSWCAEQPIWGSGIYTEDSPVCAAGIHSGEIKKKGDKVVVQKKPGHDSYGQSTRNGVTSNPRGRYSGSYVLSKSYEVQNLVHLDTDLQEVSIACTCTGKELTAQITNVFCGSGCREQQHNVWGTDIYADDSSVCAAAIHAGEINNDGGSVKVLKLPGQDYYGQSTRNTITSKNAGFSPGSFKFLSSSPNFETMIYTETAYQLPQIATDFDISSGGGMNFDINSGGGMNFDIDSGAGMNFDINSGGGMNFDINSGGGMIFDSEGMNFDINSGGGMNFDINSGVIPMHASLQQQMPSEMDFGGNSGAGMKWNAIPGTAMNMGANSRPGKQQGMGHPQAGKQWEKGHPSAGKTGYQPSVPAGAKWEMGHPPAGKKTGHSPAVPAGPKREMGHPPTGKMGHQPAVPAGPKREMGHPQPGKMGHHPAAGKMGQQPAAKKEMSLPPTGKHFEMGHSPAVGKKMEAGPPPGMKSNAHSSAGRAHASQGKGHTSKGHHRRG